MTKTPTPETNQGLEKETIESVFNKHSFNALGAISPSKDFCLLAMKEWSALENKRLLNALEYNVKVNVDLMKKLSTHSPETNTLDEAANNRVVSTLRSHRLNEDPGSGCISSDEIIEKFPDEWSLGMDMFKAGYDYAQNQSVKPIKSNRLEERRKAISQDVKDEVDAYFESVKPERSFNECKDEAVQSLTVNHFSGWKEFEIFLHPAIAPDRLNKIVDSAMELYACRPLNTWIKVSDGLPEARQRVLVYDTDRVEICNYVQNSVFGNKDGTYCFLNEQDEQPSDLRPTHWSCLPPKPTDINT